MRRGLPALVVVLIGSPDAWAYNVELGGAWKLGAGELFAVWRYSELDIDTEESDIEYILGGPMIGVRFGW